VLLPEDCIVVALDFACATPPARIASKAADSFRPARSCAVRMFAIVLSPVAALEWAVAFRCAPEAAGRNFSPSPGTLRLLANLLVDVKQEVWEPCDRAMSVFLKTQITARERFGTAWLSASIDKTYLFESSKLQRWPKAT
jgi:hypothetical protein